YRSTVLRTKRMNQNDAPKPSPSPIISQNSRLNTGPFYSSPPARRRRRTARAVPLPKARALITGLGKGREARRDAEATVDEIDSAVPRRLSTRANSALAWPTVPRRSDTRGTVSL